MTSSTKFVSKLDYTALAIDNFDQPGVPNDPQSSFAQTVVTAGDRSGQDAVSAAGSQASPRTSFNQSGDHIIRSLCIALETVELERDEHCAEALRLAIAARLAGPQTRAAGCIGESNLNRRPTRALQKWRLKRVVEYVDINLSSKVGLLDLAAIAGLSRMHFASQFRIATGLRPHEFVLRRRIQRSKELLRTSPMAIVEIAFAVGFQNSSSFHDRLQTFRRIHPASMAHGKPNDDPSTDEK